MRASWACLLLTAATENLDADTKSVADKLAAFVAKNGRSFEDMTREKNPGDTPFK